MRAEKIELRELKLSYKARKKTIKEKYHGKMQNGDNSVPATYVRMYSLGEEIFNSVSHGIGSGLAIAAIVLLIVKAAMSSNIENKALYITCFSIYGFSLFLLYIVSTLYHALTPFKAKNCFEILDHDSIYILIAGTYTPYCLLCMNSVTGWVMFGIIWTMAAFGVTIYSVYGNRMRILSSITYLPMGCLILFDIKELIVNLPKVSMVFLLIGGICYIAGWPFYMLKKVKWTHCIFHLFVLAGSTLHFFSLYYIF